ncbi:MAG: chromate transporter [Betaproteobacteria bacterium]|nr:chromate transporter [Betaproteobacteria bacterium]
MDATTTPPAAPAVSTSELFTAFLKVGLSGFGGVLPFARRMLVEQRKWLTELEFNEVLSLSQFLPGPNIVNVTVIVGRRFQGVAGAVAATLGLMLMPMVIVLALAAVYGQFAQIAAVKSATHAVSAAAAGLIIAVGFRMARPLRRTPWQVGIAVVAFAAIGVARLPLLWVLAALAPLAVGVAWWTRR